MKYGPGKIVTKIKLKFDGKWGSYIPHWRAEIYTLSNSCTFIPYGWSELTAIEDLPRAVKKTFSNLQKGGFYLDDYLAKRKERSTVRTIPVSI